MLLAPQCSVVGWGRSHSLFHPAPLVAPLTLSPDFYLLPSVSWPSCFPLPGTIGPGSCCRTGRLPACASAPLR